MNRRLIINLLDELEDVEMMGHGQFESAGQVYYEISVIVNADLEETAETIRDECDGSDWRVQTYPDWTGPIGWDHEAEEEIKTNMRIKKNLYNEHAI